MEFTTGQMEDLMRANGRLIICMARVNILGRMAEFIRVTT